MREGEAPRRIDRESMPAKIETDSEPPIGHLEEERCFVNLAGDYDYLAHGYYASQDLQIQGKTVHPTCREALDAYVPPVFLEKARTAGLSIPAYYITNGYFEPPVVVDSVNPFMFRQSIVLKAGHQEQVAKSLTRNFKYIICCQEIPEGGRVGWFRAVLGWSLTLRYRAAAADVWRAFGIPLAKVRVIVKVDGTVLLSGIWPLPFATLTPKETRYIHHVITWPTSPSS